MKFKTLLAEIAGDLNDNEEGHVYTTWQESDVRAWIKEAIGLIFDNRPDLFLELRIIKIEPCTTRQTACDCEVVRRVIGQVTKSGRLIKQLRERSLDIQLQWVAPACRRRTGSPFSLDGYAIDSVGDSLYIFPEVPPGIDVYVQVECAVRPDEDISDTTDIKSELIAAIKQWVLFRAKSIDAELAPAILQMATVHKTTFYEIVGIQAQTSVVIHRRADS